MPSVAAGAERVRGAPSSALLGRARKMVLPESIVVLFVRDDDRVEKVSPAGVDVARI